MNPHRLPQPAPWLCLFAVLFWQAAATAAPKQGEVYRMAAPAPWVVPVTPDYRDVAPDAELSNGSAYLLLDRQIRLGEKGDEHYQHVVVQVANAAGVEEQSEIGLSVDPSYQTLDIHALRVVRQGVASDQRQGARITVLAQESELEQHIYNGGYTVNILLSDVRAGDVVEYAYTVRSRELLYPGHYARRMDVGWSVPMRWQRVRLLHAPTRRRSSNGSSATARTNRCCSPHCWDGWASMRGPRSSTASEAGS